MTSKLCNIVIGIIITMIIAVASILVIPKIMGYEIYGVLSGSMEPVYKVGSVVFVKPVSPQDIKVNDTISFNILGSDDVIATHRVIAVDGEKQEFRTKGDANTVEDRDAVAFDDVIGKVQFSIPYLGYVSQFLQTKAGMLVGLGVIAFIVFLSEVSDLLKRKQKI